jgi:hypothetical protein
MTGSSERIFWYLFNSFLHVENSVVELFFCAVSRSALGGGEGQGEGQDNGQGEGQGERRGESLKLGCLNGHALCTYFVGK